MWAERVSGAVCRRRIGAGIDDESATVRFSDASEGSGPGSRLYLPMYVRLASVGGLPQHQLRSLDSDDSVRELDHWLERIF